LTDLPATGVRASVLPSDFDPVCVPAHPTRQGDRWGVSLELRRDAGGRPAALVFSSPDALATALGEHQPWIAMPMVGLRNLVVALGVDRILVDPAVAPEVPRWTADRVDAVSEQLNGGSV
jgi:hypothetical protein